MSAGPEGQSPSAGGKTSDFYECVHMELNHNTANQLNDLVGGQKKQNNFYVHLQSLAMRTD